MLKRMEFKTIALDTREGHLNTDRIYQLGYLLYETDTNMGKFSDGEHHFKDLPYFVGNPQDVPESAFKGLWDSETEYKEGDIVFDENGFYYLVINETIGEIPSESRAFLVLNPEPETNYKGEYSEEKIYNTGDYVIYENSILICLKDNTSNIPLYDMNYWKEITNDNVVKIDFQNNNVNAKICLTTANQNDDENVYDNIKIPRNHAPTINLKTGALKVPGGIERYIDETTFQNTIENFVDKSAFQELVERVEELERIINQN